MSSEYVYSGECEPTACPCGASHPWTYELETTKTGEKGCYICLKECESCSDKVFERFSCDGFKLCEECKENWLKGGEAVVMELAA